ncbi:hypothetical protein [Acidovorax sp. SUPP2539]|uniref:rolling circle replication-associated protein n=1 Tax=Acidovorax sp. SUPP2539 TaxID=2920878 RepID=UPI0023DE51D0|nr:hypothetical protein [Acidovorax sp. SUPP2539]GKS88233.1 hypothetical protein AVTE2539_02730 [Acidovorax sp. SUPP2539]
MIRIVSETNPTARHTPAELLHMHRQGIPLVPFEGKTGDGINLKAHDLGHGHTEITGSAPTVWEELDWSSMVLEHYLEAAIQHREENADELREKALTIAANRAKVKVRKLCKAMGADTLLTLTYWANETDLQRSKKDLKEFVRRLRRVMPDFRAVAVYEHQARGALHWHMATANIPATFTRTADNGQPCKVKSFDVIRAIWRSVTKERKGNIDIARRKANSRKSPAQIASYIAKYIVKAFRDGQAFSNRYSAFGDFGIPQPVSMGYYPSLRDAWAAAYGCVLDAQQIVLERLSHFKDWFVLHAEMPKKARSRPVPLEVVHA